MTHQVEYAHVDKTLHGTLGEISAIISCDTVGKAKTENHLFHELNRRGHITLAYWLCLHPLGEFINRH